MAKKKDTPKKASKAGKKKSKSSFRVKKKEFSARKKVLDEKRKHLEDLEKKLGKVDKQLSEIEEELAKAGFLESVVVDEDLKKRSKAVRLDVSIDEKRPQDKRFYRNFVMRCLECKNKFERQVNLETVQKRFYCPACGKDHSLGIHPSTRIHTVSVPKSLKLVKH